MTWPKNTEIPVHVMEIGLKAEDVFDQRKWRDMVKKTALR